MDVFLDDGRIVAIGKPGAFDDRSPAIVIDGTGKYLAPGLIDGHTHLAEIPGMTFEHERDNPDIAAAARRQIPRSYLYYGFTTLVDLNSNPVSMDQWRRAPLRPRTYFCGASPVFDGYPMSFMPTPQRYEWMPYFLFDETRADDFPSGREPGDHSPSAVVERIQADGGICVKTHYERGAGGRGNLPVPTAGLFDELVAAAHERGLPVLVHANREYSQRFAVESEVDAFAHGMFDWDDTSTTEIHDAVREIADTMIAKGIALQPTIQVLYGEQDLYDPNYFDNPRLHEVLPASLIDWYQTDDGQWWARRNLEVPIIREFVESGRWAELDAPFIARVSAVLDYFAANGGLLLFGSDTPADPTYANPPGLNGRLEMERWIAAGVTPVQLFTAATINNAEFFGLDDEIGTIEAGKRADLLILGENPLESVTAYDTIEHILLGGYAIERSTLSALAGGN